MSQVYAYSELTEKDEICAICPGIELSDGERIGAISDLDMFAMYTVDCREAIQHINKTEGLDLQLPKEYNRDLWTVESIGKEIAGMNRRRGGVARFEGVENNLRNREADERKQRIETYRLMVESGMELFPE